MLKGIDVSHHQNNVDWFAVAGDGIAFAFAKSTEGADWLDPSFERNWKGMRESGLFRGAYHYGRPASDPEVQAEHFASVTGQLAFRDLPPVLDLETADGHSPDHVLEWSKAFVTRAEGLFGRTLIIYTGGFWRFQLKNPKSEFFGARPLWLAAYTNKPILPAPWVSKKLWQYSDGKANSPSKVSGVSGPVDQNSFDGDVAQLSALCDERSDAPASTPIVPASEVAWPGTFFVWPRSPPVAGPEIVRWQQRAKSAGFDVDIDGIYGPQSKAACRSFQKERGLPVDGIVGRETWVAMFEAGHANA